MVLVLRGTGILGKFLLSFLITKKISLDFQGTFSLVSTTVTLLVLFYGLDFYVYSNKLIIQNKEQATFYLKNNLFFYFSLYLVFTPLIYVLAKLFLNDFSFSISLLVLVVIFEHLGQEFFRMFIALKRVYFANLLLFLRTGLWAILTVLYLWFAEKIKISINDLLIVWAMSSGLTVALSFIIFPNVKKLFKEKLDIKWIKKGVNVASQMFLATIFLKVIEFSDRYLIDYFYDKEYVGIYTFYFQLANLSNVIIFTLYISFLYPELINSIYVRNEVSTKRLQQEIRNKTIIVTIGLSLIYALLLPVLLRFVERPVLNNYSWLLYGLLLGNLFLNLSYAWHYSLIGYNREIKILKVTFIGFVFSLTLNLFLIKAIGIWGAVLSQILSGLLMFFLKRREAKIYLHDR